MGLSAPVESAVGGAIAIVESLIAKVAQPVDGSTSEFQTATS
jgi:hypothetical protein